MNYLSALSAPNPPAPLAPAGSAMPVAAAPATPAPVDELPTLNARALDVYRIPEDPGALGELIGMFLQDLPSRVAAIRAAFKAADQEALKAAAHTLKGSAGNLGGLRLASLSAEVEKLARTNDWDAIRPRVAEIEAEAVKLQAALTEEATPAA
jgi:HPt (histidine-containing phosphotransfer) domain-containing protein